MTLVQLARNAPTAAARLVGRVQDHNLRRADLVWLDEAEAPDWVMIRLIDLVRQANRDSFGFDLDAFSESPQIASYDAAAQGHFTWHSDIGDGPLAARRKLTLVAQLDAPGAYAGGDLELMPGAQTVAADRSLGAVTVFPSYVLHRVTPVSQGRRRSLTVWAHGPAFR